jgi:DNA-binding Lrp family transcriptional regulator
MVVYKDYNFGARVYEVMRAQHVLPTELSRRLGVSPGSVFRLFRMRSADLDKIRHISVTMNYDFIAEIGATSGGMKAVAALEAERDAARLAFERKEAELLEKMKLMQEQIAEQKVVIEKLHLEVGYLKEVVAAYKR